MNHQNKNIYFSLSLIIISFLHIIYTTAHGDDDWEKRYKYNQEVINAREANYSIHPIILGRSSLREMSSEAMSDKELFPLFEAARWSPSFFNAQEWRFVYAKRNSNHWESFLGTLLPSNQEWCRNASVLVYVLSSKYELYKDRKLALPTHSFDAGLATMALLLEANGRGLVAHPMGGFNYTRAAEVIHVSNNTDYNVEAMIAIGKRLPKEKRVLKEIITQREPISKFISEAVFVEK